MLYSLSIDFYFRCFILFIKRYYFKNYVVRKRDDKVEAPLYLTLNKAVIGEPLQLPDLSPNSRWVNDKCWISWVFFFCVTKENIENFLAIIKLKDDSNINCWEITEINFREINLKTIRPLGRKLCSNVKRRLPQENTEEVKEGVSTTNVQSNVAVESKLAADLSKLVLQAFEKKSNADSDNMKKDAVIG